MKILTTLLTIFSLNLNTSKKEPARLDKKENCSIQLGFDSACEKMAPYVLVACIIVISVLLFIVLVKYGANITGTEANQYYNGNWR